MDFEENLSLMLYQVKSSQVALFGSESGTQPTKELKAQVMITRLVFSYNVINAICELLCTFYPVRYANYADGKMMVDGPHSLRN